MRRLPTTLLALAMLPAVTPPAAARAADPPGGTEVAVVSTRHVTTDALALEAFDTPMGLRSTYPDDGAGYSAYVVRGSRDGSRTVTADQFRAVGSRLVVRDISGAVVREIYTPVSEADLESPVLSPSGDRVAYFRELGFEDDGAQGIVTCEVAGLCRQAHVEDASELAFVTEDLLVYLDRSGSGELFRARSASTGALRPVVGLPDGATAIALDPAGTTAVWVRRPTATSSLRLEAAAVTVSPTRVAFGAARTLAEGPLGQPAFTRDGTGVIASAGADGARDLVRVPLAGGAPAPFGLPTSAVDERSVVIGVRETTPPAAPALGPAVLAGTSARLALRLPADPTLSRLRLTRTSPGLPTVTRDVLVPTTSFTDDGLVLGRTYSYVAHLIDRSGNAGPAAGFALTAMTQPMLRLAEPLAAVTMPIRVADDRNGPSARYSLDLRTSTGGWTRVRTLSKERFAFVPGTPGQAYDARAQAVDAYGNATAPVVSSAPAVIPLDQGRFSFSGSTLTTRRQDAYGGTSAFLRAAGASATIRVAGDRLTVFGETCATCGAFDVFVDGVRRARVDTREDRFPAARRVLWSQTFASGPARTLVVRAVGTPGRPTVVLDAVAARPFTPPATLRQGQQLLRGQQLRSVNRAHRLVLQRDGNVVLYDARSRPLWNTATRTGVRLVVQANATLALLDARGRTVFRAGGQDDTAGAVTLQDDGQLVLSEAGSGRPLWSSRSGAVTTF